MKTHVTRDGDRDLEFVLDGSTTCPRPDWCDVKPGEAHRDYVIRHAHEHELDFPSQTNFEDIERNLPLYCLYYGHKYLIGNRTLTPYPFWETHEFVNNWVFSPEDLEMQMWDESDPAAAEGYTFELKPHDDRLPGVYKRFKELELPRGCQKTSTVCKAYVTMSHLRQRYLFDNIYHRIIITSATTTLTEGVTNALKALWGQNKNIKRLYGIDRYRQVLKKGEMVPVFLRRDGIYGGKTKNTLNLRWTKDADDATGLTSFAVLYAGIKTETQGQRADEYIFDDGNTKKNSRMQERRAEVLETFTEQIRQLDPTGKMIVVNTRQHMDDFGGKIKTPEFRGLFHIMHRRSRFIEPKTGQEKPYYPIDGLGRERYSLAILDGMAMVTPEQEMWCEFQNCPRNPKTSLFNRDDFQVVDDNDPRIPIEIKAGLSREPSREEQVELDRAMAQIRAFDTCDPASKEEQSRKGDDSVVLGHRFTMRTSDWWITDIRMGQWDSNELWNQNYLAWVRNRPRAADYELPASEMHVQSSFEAWKSNTAAAMGFPISMQLDFESLPRAGKPVRIAALTPWTKNKKVYILKSAGSPEMIAKFIRQFVNYPGTDHDDGPDAMSRCLRYVPRPSMEQVMAAVAAKTGPRMTPDGMGLRTTMEHVMAAFEDPAAGRVKNWGAAGRRVA